MMKKKKKANGIMISISQKTSISVTQCFIRLLFTILTKTGLFEVWAVKLNGKKERTLLRK